MKRTRIPLLLVSMVLSCLSSASADDPPTLLLAGARVLNAAGDGHLEDQSVVVEEGRIARIRSRRSVPPPSPPPRSSVAAAISAGSPRATSPT